MQPDHENNRKMVFAIRFTPVISVPGWFVEQMPSPYKIIQ
jgi:hypothetical protein